MRNCFFCYRLQLRLFFAAVFFHCCVITYGQGKRTIKVIERDAASRQNHLAYFPAVAQKDSLSCLAYLEAGVKKARQSGYIAASIDSVKWYPDSVIALFYSGKLYKWAILNQGNVDNEYLKSKEKGLLRNELFSIERANTLMESVIHKCENTGYPFARIKLDSISVNDSVFTAHLMLDKGPFITIDSIRLNGPETVAPVYLYNYLGLRPGDTYQESTLSKVEIRLKELPFLKTTRSPSVLFSDKYTRLDLFIDRKKASQFDGVIGILPDATGKGKTSLTGEVHIKLQNSFKRGETIELNWKQVPPRSQDLNLHVRYPFLFNTPIGADGFIGLYRRDSLFVDVIKNIGVMVTMKGNNFIKGFIDNKQSNLQSTYGLENVTSLPSYADVSTTAYGISGHWEESDYKLNPRRGIRADLLFNAGNRTIRKNPGVNPSVYENIALSSTQYKSDIRLQLFIPLYHQHVFTVANRTAFIYSPTLFINEMYRIGGLTSLRGFDEESIFATTFSIVNAEYRYLTDINSFLFVFLNGAWYERNGGGSYFKDTPLGFGAGYNFETRLGIMSISYALGEQRGAPLQIRNGKVHFGIVNYF